MNDWIKVTIMGTGGGNDIDFVFDVYQNTLEGTAKPGEIPVLGFLRQTPVPVGLLRTLSYKSDSYGRAEIIAVIELKWNPLPTRTPYWSPVIDYDGPSIIGIHCVSGPAAIRDAERWANALSKEEILALPPPRPYREDPPPRKPEMLVKVPKAGDPVPKTPKEVIAALEAYERRESTPRKRRLPHIDRCPPKDHIDRCGNPPPDPPEPVDLEAVRIRLFDYPGQAEVVRLEMGILDLQTEGAHIRERVIPALEDKILELEAELSEALKRNTKKADFVPHWRHLTDG